LLPGLGWLENRFHKVDNIFHPDAPLLLRFPGMVEVNELVNEDAEINRLSAQFAQQVAASSMERLF
jgi:hypothetical protein